MSDILLDYCCLNVEDACMLLADAMVYIFVNYADMIAIYSICMYHLN